MINTINSFLKENLAGLDNPALFNLQPKGTLTKCNTACFALKDPWIGWNKEIDFNVYGNGDNTPLISRLALSSDFINELHNSIQSNNKPDLNCKLFYLHQLLNSIMIEIKKENPKVNNFVFHKPGDDSDFIKQLPNGDYELRILGKVQ